MLEALAGSVTVNCMVAMPLSVRATGEDTAQVKVVAGGTPKGGRGRDTAVQRDGAAALVWEQRRLLGARGGHKLKAAKEIQRTADRLKEIVEMLPGAEDACWVKVNIAA
jgi:hypothetical protein